MIRKQEKINKIAQDMEQEKQTKNPEDFNPSLRPKIDQKSARIVNKTNPDRT